MLPDKQHGSLEEPGGRRTVLVTGAAGAIGRATTSEFRRRRFQVFGIDAISKPGDLELDGYLELDLAQLARVTEEVRRELLQDVLSWIGEASLDVLVNNAAVQILQPFEDLDADAWRTTLDVNLLAPVFLVKTFLPALEKVQGTVINISSIHARATKPNFVAYATSKAALSGLTRAMAVDLGSRIRVNAIEPASVATPMLMASFEGNPGEFEKLVHCHPQAKVSTPEEVAALIYAVAVGAFGTLHGACIDLSGGVSSRLHDPL